MLVVTSVHLRALNIIMRTLFFRRPKKRLILGGFLGIFVVFFFLARYHAPERIHASLPAVDNVNLLRGRPQEARIEIPLAVAKARDHSNENSKINPFNDKKDVDAVVPDQIADLVKEHIGPHQPAAVEKHFGVGGDGGGNIPDGPLPDNAQVAQDALQAIHDAAKEHENQEEANLAVPDNMDLNVNQQDNPAEHIENEEDDGGIPFHLTPRRPPERSSSLTKGPGEGGKAVVINKDSLSPIERKKYEEGEKNNAFNEYASNLISVRRYIPDIRESQCLDFKYTQKHEPASIILCFHNEAWSVLLRSVHSILDRSKTELVKEIILVDDASTMDHLKRPLEVYMNFLQKVKIIRAEERQGLIRARMLGAKAATGKVLVFLDSHIECTTGWLEPLLDRIAENNTNVVVPVIDVISSDTLQYNHAPSRSVQVGGFDWSLIFRWHPIPPRDAVRPGAPNSPVRTPTMAGGLFAISTEFFERLGWYDPGYEVWGAENLELSFKTWMCGGQLETIPCSHVGHIFRSRSPYSWKVKTANPLKHNLLRLAEVVLGEDYKRFYFSRVNYNEGDMGDVSDRKKILKDLNCKSFKWYLDNIYPEMFIPSESLASGEIRNVATGHCVDAVSPEKKNRVTVVGYPCHNQGGNQFFLLSKSFELRRDDYCFDSGYEPPQISMGSCHSQGGNQHFEYTDNNEIRQNNNCMTISANGKKITMEKCTGSEYQKWVMSRKPFVPQENGAAR
nr:Ricin B lectin [Hymenolepis microstoma]